MDSTKGTPLASCELLLQHVAGDSGVGEWYPLSKKSTRRVEINCLPAGITVAAAPSHQSHHSPVQACPVDSLNLTSHSPRWMGDTDNKSSYHVFSSRRGAAGPTRCFSAPHMWQLGWGNPSADIIIDQMAIGGCPCLLVVTSIIMCLPWVCCFGINHLICDGQEHGKHIPWTQPDSIQMDLSGSDLATHPFTTTRSSSATEQPTAVMNSWTPCTSTR